MEIVSVQVSHNDRNHDLDLCVTTYFRLQVVWQLWPKRNKQKQKLFFRNKKQIPPVFRGMACYFPRFKSSRRQNKLNSRKKLKKICRLLQMNIKHAGSRVCVHYNIQEYDKKQGLKIGE